MHKQHHSCKCQTKQIIEYANRGNITLRNVRNSGVSAVEIVDFNLLLLTLHVLVKNSMINVSEDSHFGKKKNLSDLKSCIWNRSEMSFSETVNILL